jgi:SAM-dependent methyltransferase
MEYYRSSSLRTALGAGNEVTLVGMAGPAAINARLEPVSSGAGLHAVHATAPGLQGMGFPAAYKAGAFHTACVKIRLGSASTVRLEVHGRATRMQKAVAVIAADGSILSQAEEVSGIESCLRADGTIDVRMSFVPFRSLIEWFYVFCADDRSVAAPDGGEPLFYAGAFSLFAEPLPSSLRCAAHLPARPAGGMLAACQNLLVLRNYVHLQVEMHKPGARLTGLDLACAYPVAHAQWWTWNPPAAVARKAPTAEGAMRLTARRPSAPVPSPALMDLLGPACAHEGHAITLLFADLPDFAGMSLEDSDKACQIVLHAHFDDGSSQTIDVLQHLQPQGDEDPWIQLVLHHLAAAKSAVEGPGTFLEAGARGVGSAHMRQLVCAAGWRYLGIDISAHSNVDIIADAHCMGPEITDGSITAVYSSEVIEHLISPLHFVLEANRVLAAGGLFIARAPSNWPLHAEPWDFWRFSQHCWQGLLNRSTGFEILESCEFGEASVVPSLPVWTGAIRMALSPAPLLTGVIGRKICTAKALSIGWSADLPSGRYDHA